MIYGINLILRFLCLTFEIRINAVLFMKMLLVGILNFLFGNRLLTAHHLKNPQIKPITVPTFFPIFL